MSGRWASESDQRPYWCCGLKHSYLFLPDKPACPTQSPQALAPRCLVKGRKEFWVSK
ncbi:mCG147611 [Mus musculus]|nr:mCG147611 [Mus musculus]